MRRCGPPATCGRKRSLPHRCDLDVDFDEHALSVEIDGQQHMEVLPWWEDMQRNNEVVVEGGEWLLRFAGFALRRQTEHVAGVLVRFFDRHQTG